MRATVLLGAIVAALAQQGDGIIRLKPSEFRQLPQAVRRDLDRRGCRIPQTPFKTAPHNVISGSFIAAGSRDWAVLCSVKANSRILIYRNGGAGKIDSVGRADDSVYLRRNDTRVLEFSRKLEIAEPKSIAARAKSAPAALGHDGIEDAAGAAPGRASTIRYYWRSKWRESLAAD